MILRSALEKLDEAIDGLEKNADAVAFAPTGAPDSGNERWRRQTVARLDGMIARIETALADNSPTTAG